MGEQQPRDRLGRLVGHEVAHPRHDLEPEGPGDEIGGEPGRRGPDGGVAVTPDVERRHRDRADLDRSQGSGRAVPGQGRLQRGRLAQHREVLLDGGEAHSLVGQQAAEAPGAVLEQAGTGGGIVEDPVMARAVLLIVGVLVEGPAERGRMGPRQNGEGAEPSRMAVRGDPRHVAAPVVADQVKRPAGCSARVGKVEHVLDQPVDAVGGQAPGRVRPHAGGVAALVRGHRAVAGRAQRGNLVPPGVARLRVAVQEQDERAVGGAGDVRGEAAFRRRDHVTHSGRGSVQTVKPVRVVLPNDVVRATSTASRPRPMSTRPMRGSLWRASIVCHRSPR